MRKWLVAIVIFVLVSNVCFARLGEDKKQIIARYGGDFQGEPSKNPNFAWKMQFGSTQDPAKNDPLEISVYLDENDVCQEIAYVFSFQKFQFHKDENIEEAKKTVYDLLEKNSQGGKWGEGQAQARSESEFHRNEAIKSFMSVTWTRSDGGIATWSRMGPQLTITSGQAARKKQKGQDEKKLRDELQKKGALGNL